MQTIEIARKFTALGQKDEAVKAYKLALSECKDEDLATELECALHILQFGHDDDYKIAYTCFKDLFNRGFAQADILTIMDEAFYQPNVKMLQRRYEKNCRLLTKYPYIFRQNFLAFTDLPIIFFPYDDNQYTPYYVQKQKFGEYINFRHPVVSRNFFRDLTKPILAADVFSQYELEYLHDNVRKSEYVAKDNHIYLHYTSWPVFCAYLQVLDLQPLLKDKKIVFLIEDEIKQYPIDFKQRFDIDYSQYPLRRIGIREINKLIWHTQLSADNGGDFFNEVFDSHPNLLAKPSIMFDDTVKTIEKYEKALHSASNVQYAKEIILWPNKRLVAELYNLPNRTAKDILVAIYLKDQEICSPYLDKSSRIAPAIFFQPHFPNIFHDLWRTDKGKLQIHCEQYDEIFQSPIFSGFKYIKTFTPMRTITSSYAATIRYKCFRMTAMETDSVMDDALINRILNLSFFIDWQNRLFKDCRLVRFEDGKLNSKATFTALAAFLDLPYTESMTYCSQYGVHDPVEDVGNDTGFSPASIYRKNARYANNSERAFIEFCLRDVYKFYGYDFEYYDGQPVDENKIKKWVKEFTVIDNLIRQSEQRYFIEDAGKFIDAKENEKEKKSTDEYLLAAKKQLGETFLNKYMEKIYKKRMTIGKILMQNDLQFINQNGQPLHMMPLLEPDPALLVMPLYRSTTYPKVDIEVKEFGHEEMKPLEKTN